jgi:DNA repair protein RadC
MEEIMKQVYRKYQLKLVNEKVASYGKVRCAQSTIEVIKKMMKPEQQAEEIVFLACLDTSLEIIGMFEVSRGTLNSSQVHPREIFKRACLLNTHGIILAHNHPSGEIKPSEADDQVTRQIKQASDIMGIKFLDHVIFGDNKFFSYCQETHLLS